MSDALSAVKDRNDDLDLSGVKTKSLKKYLKGEGKLVEKTKHYNDHFVGQMVKRELKSRK